MRPWALGSMPSMNRERERKRERERERERARKKRRKEGRKERRKEKSGLFGLGGRSEMMRGASSLGKHQKNIHS
jgi:hypothetical protein